MFLIGNHADELTPWVPVIATLCSASGYLSIPCCAWTFDSRFERSKNLPFETGMDVNQFADTLHLGGDGSNSSSYSQYRIWLASLSMHCGWKVESETLRIPSTRNWALIGECLCCITSIVKIKLVQQGETATGRHTKRRRRPDDACWILSATFNAGEYFRRDGLRVRRAITRTSRYPLIVATAACSR